MNAQNNSELQVIVKALGYLKTHWWLILLEVAMIYGVSLNSYYRARPVYQSNASVLIDNSRRQMYQSYMMMASSNNNSRKQNVAHLLTGQEVMDRFRVHMTELFNEGGRPSYLKQFFPSGVAVPAQTFRSAVNLAWDHNSDIYNIVCEAESPDAAHDLCQGYMGTVKAYYPEIGQREAMMKREFLSRQISSLTRQIAERELNLVDFQKKSPDFINFLLVDTDGTGRNKMQTALGAVQEAIDTNRATKQLFIRTPRAKRGEQSVLQPTINALTAHISDLEYQLRLVESSGEADKSQRASSIRKEISEVSSQLAQANDDDTSAYINNPIASGDLRKRLASLELEYRINLIRKKSIESALIDFNVRERKFSQQRLEYDRLKTELRHRRRLLTNLYNREQETELELSAGNAEIYRLQEPTRNMTRVSPQLSKHMYGSLSLSLFVVIVSLVLLMAFFPRLDSEAEVNRLSLPVIGKVPYMRGSTRVSEEMPSYALESLKIMNYRLLRETKDIKCPIVIITSPHAREGKSTVTNCLTIASQSPGRKTLLIDGDLLTARPNRFFGIQEDQTPGLYSAVMSETPVDPSTLIVKTMNEGLSFMPRGDRLDPTVIPNFLKPVEVMLAELRTQYDIIFIDTPPLFASNLSHQWSGIADLIVIVARIYLTRPKDVTEAIQTCKVFSRAAVGIALNCVPMTGPYRRANNYYFSKKKTKPGRLAA